MAYTVSQGYNDIIYSGNAKNKLKVLFNNVEMQDIDNFCEKLTIKSRIIAEDGSKRFSLNNFIAKECELILHDVDIADLQDQVNISIGTLVNNSYEYVPIGVFNIQDTPTTDGKTTTIKLRDNAVKFDFNYNAQPLIEENGGSVTKLQLLQDICTKAGVTCNISSFIGSTDLIGIYDNTITARVYIADIAEQAGAIATINRSGELIFIYINNLTKNIIPLNVVEKYTLGERYTIGRVEYESGIIKYTTGNVNDYLYLDSSNPYVSSQSQVESIYSIVNGVSIDSLETERIIGNPTIDCYDLISITDNNIEYITLANYTLTYTGVLTMKFSTLIGLEERKSNVSINSEATFRNWARTEIDNVEASVSILAGKTQVISDELTSVGQVTLSNAYPTILHRLSIYGDIKMLFGGSTIGLYGVPMLISEETTISDNTYISETFPHNYSQIYPSDTLYSKSSVLLVDNTEYVLNLDFLNYMNSSVYDEFIYEEGKQYIIRRVGINNNGQMYELPNEVIENRGDLEIQVKSNSTIKLKSFSNVVLSVQYLLKNDYTNVFANSIETSAKIKLTNDRIEQSVEAVTDDNGKVTAASIVQAINNGESETNISSDKINFEGKEFNVTTEQMKISIGTGENKRDLINSTGVLTNLIFNGEMWGWIYENGYDGNQAGFVGYNTNWDYSQGQQSFINFCVRIPRNFKVLSAKIYLRHTPMVWYAPNGIDYSIGKCQNLNFYLADGLGQSGLGAYNSEMKISGDDATYQLLALNPITFTSNEFQEVSSDDFANIFNSSGTYNIVVKSSDPIPYGFDVDTAYTILGSKTGILTGVCEIVGYSQL